MKPGKVILIADGSLSLKVLECNNDGIKTEILNNCILGERKNVNLPGCEVLLETITDKDKNDIINFGLKYDVDFIAASFVRSKNDVKIIRKLLNNSDIKIISKIENQEGLKN